MAGDNAKTFTSVCLSCKDIILLKKVTGSIQSGREISAIFVTHDYLCYKETKSPFNVNLF